MFKSRTTICGITFPSNSTAVFPSAQVSRSKSSCRVKAMISFRLGSSSTISASGFVTVLLHSFYRKQDGESGPHSRFAFEHDFPIHQLYQLLCNGEPQSNTAVVAYQFRAYLLKGFEDGGLYFFG